MEAMRFFNTEGPVRADDHYRIPPLERIDLRAVLDLVRSGKYFVLHAPRQTGKTSALLALRDLLNGGGAGDCRCVYANFEVGQAGREDTGRAMRAMLGELGLLAWFTDRVSGVLGGGHWLPAFLSLSLIYFYVHYFFASNTAHVSAMYAPFLALAIAVGAPPVLAALVLAFFSNLFASMTHYGTAPAPILFGSGNVDVATWWKLGALISVVNVAIWLGAGSLWWRLLGLW